MKRKLLSVFMVLVLAIGCVFSLTACGNANEKYNEFVKTAAKDYYETHVDYKNFEDITIEYSAEFEVSEPNEDAEGKFDTMKTEMIAKVAIQKVGEEYALLSESNSTQTMTSWVLKEGSTTEYEEKTNTSVTTVKTVMGSKLENQIASFFATQEVLVKMGDVVANERKDYRMLTEDQYVSAIEDAMEDISGILNDVFETGTKTYLAEVENEGYEMELKVKKEDATLKIFNEDFGVSSYDGYIEGGSEITYEFVGGAIDNVAISMNSTASIGGTMSQTANASFAYSADVPVISSFDGYTMGMVSFDNLVPDMYLGIGG